MRTRARRPGDVTWLATISLLALGAAGCARAAQAPMDDGPQPAVVVEDPTMAVAELRDPSGAPVGTARLTADENGTIHLQLHVDRLTAGEHGVHFHSVGSCQRGDSTAFASAGGHHNPLKRKHGLENPEGPHAGDLPNLHVMNDGRASFEVLNTILTIQGGNAPLLDQDGNTVKRQLA